MASLPPARFCLSPQSGQKEPRPAAIAGRGAARRKTDGFWSISVNAKGYFEPNPQNAYTLSNISAKPGPDGSIAIQFGGCDGNVPNCLPITPGWNYLVRLYRPRAEVLDGRWIFPDAKPAD